MANRTSTPCKRAQAYTRAPCWKTLCGIVVFKCSSMPQWGGHDWASPCAEISCVCFRKHFSSAVICMRIECELCCQSCIILNIVCKMDVIDSATALHIKRAQRRHIGIIHSGNRGLQDHQMNTKPLIKTKLWHDTLPLSWATSDNKRMLDDDDKCWRGEGVFYVLALFLS